MPASAPNRNRNHKWRTPLATALLLLGMHSPSFASSDLLQVDLNPGSLHEALLEFATEHRISIFFAEESVAGVDVPAIRGTYTLTALLTELLAGQCLQFEFVRDTFVAITPGCNPQPIAEAEAQPPGGGALPAPYDEAPDLVEEVFVRERYVTGSRLRNPAFGQTMPLDVIDSAEIRLSGFQSVAELLRYVPAVAGNSTSTLVSNGGDGTATVTLRGLPASNTLVLLNGRRLNTDALSGSAVDLNTLPLAMVDRIEILKDGVSAIYGSDAVAGVVNVITRQGSDGLSVAAYSGISDENDLQTDRFSASLGGSGQRWSASLGIDFYDQQGVLSADRDISASSDDRARGGTDKRSSATAPARVTVNDVPLILSAGASGLNAADFRPATDDDRFEFRDFTSAIVPSRRFSSFLQASFDLNQNWDTYTEVLYSTTEASTRLAQVPLFSDFEIVPIRIEADQMFNPFGQPITDIRRRFVEMPPRSQENETDTLRTLIGFRSEGAQRSHDFYLQYSQTDAKERNLNAFDARRLINALSSGCTGDCVPLNVFGQPGSVTGPMLDYLRTSATIEGTSRLITLAINSDWLIDHDQLGAIEVSSGLEYRRDELETRPDELLNANALLGGGNRSSTNGDRDIVETYAEVFVPIARDQPWLYRLHAQVAARASYYSDFGFELNPRLLFSWQPTPAWAIRASAARGFRAPSLLQLHGSEKQSFEQLNDPCTVPQNVGVLAGCATQADPTLTQFLTTTGGDSDLEPERSTTLSLGLLWQQDWANSGASLSIDWFNIDQRDVVESSAQYLLNQNARFGAFAGRIGRNSEGNLIRVLATLQNIGRREVEGFDLTGSWQHNFRQYGRLTASVNATHIAKFRDKFDPDSSFVDKAGTFSDEASGGLGALPDWKLNAGASWQSAYWSSHYSIYYVSSLDETVPLLETERTIDSWITHSFNLTYRGPWTGWTSVTLGINNLWDEQPPFAASAFNDSYDGRTYDLTGRYFYLRLERDFFTRAAPAS